MTVAEAHNNVLFTVRDGETEIRALQLVERIAETIYAHTVIVPGDLVLVAEVPGFMLSPSMTESDAIDSVSHVIIGLVPPGEWHEVPGYSSLVKGL